MRTLLQELERRRPDVSGPAEVIASGRVLVNGSVITNPASRVPKGASIVVRPLVELRGRRKLSWALQNFGARVDGRVALDVGAATGGFVTALLDAGAAKVYAVDAGWGQLLGSLRQDPRVVNLEATNVAELGEKVVPEAVGLVTVDVSYLSLASAVGQLDSVVFEPDAELVGLVKPMFELRLDRAPSDRPALDRALRLAVEGVEAAGWSVVATADSPHPGSRGALELFVHAEKREASKGA